MTDLEKLTSLISRAKNKQFNKFQFICTIDEYLTVRIYRNSLLRVKTVFNRLKVKAFRSYIKFLKANDDENAYKYILAFRSYQDCEDFYRKDAAIISDEMAEYRAYLTSGNFFSQLCGNMRDADDLYDYRMKEIRNLADKD